MPVAAPRLAITDTDGERIVHIDKARFTIGRNADVDLRLEAGDISRQHAEIVAANGGYVLRDLKSSWGTFVNGERTAETPLAHGDEIRFGGSRETSIVFQLDAVPREAASIEKQVASAATELRQVGTLLKGLRALGSGRVVDEVLTLVLDSAIDVTGAERGFIMLANRDKQLDFKLGRARGQVTLPGRTFATSRKIPDSGGRSEVAVKSIMTRGSWKKSDTETEPPGSPTATVVWRLTTRGGSHAAAGRPRRSAAARVTVNVAFTVPERHHSARKVPDPR